MLLYTKNWKFEYIKAIFIVGNNHTIRHYLKRKSIFSQFFIQACDFSGVFFQLTFTHLNVRNLKKSGNLSILLDKTKISKRK